MLHPAQANALADRIEELIPKLTDGAHDSLGWLKEKAEKFVAGCRMAVERGEDIDFH